MTRRQLIRTLVLTAGLTAGCGDLGSMIYFLMPEQKIPPEIQDLACQNKKKASTAMILVHGSLDQRFEFADVDKRLAQLVRNQIQELCKHNDEYLTLIETAKVENFKSDHSDWAEMSPAEIGKWFKVDYVIVIDVNELSLYERNSPMIYRGTADLAVSLVNINDPDSSPLHKDYRETYPGEANIIPTDQEPWQSFRDRFLNHVAKKLSYCFVPHPVQENHMSE